ncbi:hypothetical protein RN001_004507 [Aquatica leii]|uniref:Nose resistant-to-fluoxetine protein N-terminal domain-containing protein n=1 Tax=Aquatica leii TaxID=1421715 RepID=A0AAN7SPK0_9COLE|nr:hypothetical protein RN001_004507 [Aquatica leii]
MIWFVFVFLLATVQVHGVNKYLRAQSVLYGLSSLTEKDNENSTCLQELFQLYEGVNNRHLWALKALDASGQPESGFLWGNNLWIGSHFQCSDISNKRPLEINHLKVKQPEETAYDYPPYEMAFAMAYMKHNSTQQQHAQMPLESTIQLGLCIPKSCSTNELHELLNNYLNTHFLYAQEFYNLNIEISSLKILDDDSWMFLPKTMAALCVFLVSVFLVILGTIYDVKITQPRLKAKMDCNVENNNAKVSSISIINNFKSNGVEESQDNDSKFKVKKVNKFKIVFDVLQCFSIYSNVKALTKTKITTDAISSIHGVRLFSLIWVICVHTIFYQIDFLKNVPTGFRLSEYFLVQVLSNSTYCVDSFLFLSGFLLAYTFYKSKQGIVKCKRPVNVLAKVSEFFMMFTHRYLRLTPVYLITILVADVLFSYYRQSSSLNVVEKPDIECSQHWWRNVLYINNFYPRSEMCLSWSWYLSADTQFFMVSTILLIVSTIWFKTAVSILLFLIVVCMGATGYRSYSVGYIPTMDEQFIQLDAIYDLPWNRIGPYLVGVITGYVLTIKLEGKLNLRKPYLILLWIICPLINLWIVFTLYGRQISVEFSAVYMGLSRSLWGIGLGWLIIACSTNNAGIVNKFLSFRGWIPLSRLTYCGYLIHPLLIHVIYLSAESSQSASLSSFALSIFGIGMLTLFFAFWYSLFFESPYILLTKLLFNQFKKPKEPKTTNGAL